MSGLVNLNLKFKWFLVSVLTLFHFPNPRVMKCSLTKFICYHLDLLCYKLKLTCGFFIQRDKKHVHHLLILLAVLWKFMCTEFPISKCKSKIRKYIIIFKITFRFRPDYLLEENNQRCKILTLVIKINMIIQKNARHTIGAKVHISS